MAEAGTFVPDALAARLIRWALPPLCIPPGLPAENFKNESTLIFREGAFCIRKPRDSRMD